MRRLDGNNILIVEADRTYNSSLCEVFCSTGAQTFSVLNSTEAFEALRVYDFDVVICNYYLTDGLIHSIIDWCKAELDYLPVFVALGVRAPVDEALLTRQLISGVFPKGNDHEKLVKAIQGFLFDYNQFYEDLLSLTEPNGVTIELVVKNNKILVNPLEINSQGIFLSIHEHFDVGTYGLLRLTIYNSGEIKNFTAVGFLGCKHQNGQHFKIIESCIPSWLKVLKKLDERQLSITGFLKKASGK